jgi:hypothetical protein
MDPWESGDPIYVVTPTPPHTLWLDLENLELYRTQELEAFIFGCSMPALSIVVETQRPMDLLLMDVRKRQLHQVARTNCQQYDPIKAGPTGVAYECQSASGAVRQLEFLDYPRQRRTTVDATTMSFDQQGRLSVARAQSVGIMDP